MLRRQFFIALPVIACALALTLSGCAAVPLVQLAAAQMAPQPACPTMSACQPGPTADSYGDLSRGFGDSFRKLTSLVSGTQPLPPQAPAR
jgi:hypothetical protein